MKKIFFISLAIVLAGCATMEWRHTSGNLANLAYHQQLCNNEFHSRVPMPPRGADLVAWNTLIQIKRVQFVDTCMSRNGYYQVEVQR